VERIVSSVFSSRDFKTEDTPPLASDDVMTRAAEWRLLRGLLSDSLRSDSLSVCCGGLSVCCGSLRSLDSLRSAALLKFCRPPRRPLSTATPQLVKPLNTATPQLFKAGLPAGA
jgi:hypothetical protein